MKVSYALIGVHLNFVGQRDTGDLLIQNSSFEGISLAAVRLANTNDFTWYNVVISGNEWESANGVITPLGENKPPWLRNLVCHGNTWIGTGGMYAPRNDVYLSLPNQKLAVAYPGFEEVQLADLPTEATLLIGHQDAFQEHFHFPCRD